MPKNKEKLEINQLILIGVFRRIVEEKKYPNYNDIYFNQKIDNAIKKCKNNRKAKKYQTIAKIIEKCKKGLFDFSKWNEKEMLLLIGEDNKYAQNKIDKMKFQKDNALLLDSEIFFIAVNKQDKNKILKLISMGIDINQLDFNGYNALFHAVINKDVVTARVLIINGIDINAIYNHKGHNADDKGDNVLTYSINNLDVAMTTLLINYGIDINSNKLLLKPLEQAKSYLDNTIKLKDTESARRITEIILILEKKEQQFPQTKNQYQQTSDSSLLVEQLIIAPSSYCDLLSITKEPEQKVLALASSEASHSSEPFDFNSAEVAN